MMRITGGITAALVTAFSGGALAQGAPPAASFEVQSGAAAQPVPPQPAAAAPAAPAAPAAQPADVQPAAAEPAAPQPAVGEPAPVAAPFTPAPEPPQGTMAKNGVFIELLGPGLLYSLNYERIIGDAVSVRLGVSGWGSGSSQMNDTSSIAVAVPVTISYVGIRDRQHGFEVGGGGSFLYGGSTNSGASAVSVAGTGGLATLFGGYRLHPVGKTGFQFRGGLGIQAMFINGSSLIYPWPYLSLGAGF